MHGARETYSGFGEEIKKRKRDHFKN